MASLSLIYKNNKRLLNILTRVLVLLVAVTIFQDYVDSRRNSYAFYFSESLLFKTNWLLFIPLLMLQVNFLLKRHLHKGLAIFIPMILHLLILPLTIWGLSSIFFSNAYSYYKILTYTLSHDLYKLFLIYGAVAFFYKSRRSIISSEENIAERSQGSLKKVTVSNGRNYTAIGINEIYYLKAATPYIAIYTEEKHYLHTATLKSLQQELDGKQFLRVHRSSIVNLEKVAAYRSRLNGDYDLILNNGSEVRLSRNYVSGFKKNFENIPQVKL